MLPDLARPAPFAYRAGALAACRFPAHAAYRLSAAQVAAPLALAGVSLLAVYVPAVLLGAHRHPLLLPHALAAIVAWFAFANAALLAAAHEPAVAHLAALLLALHLLHAVRAALTPRDALAPRDIMPGQAAAAALLRATELAALGAAWFLAPVLAASPEAVLYALLAPEPLGAALNLLLAPLAWGTASVVM
jgi:hypothetical protein